MFDFLSSKFSSIFSALKGSTRLTESTVNKTFEQVHDALLQADVPLQVVENFIGELKKEITGQTVTKTLKADEYLMKLVYDKVVQFLGGTLGKETTYHFKIPTKIMLMGLQGSGKTTTAIKLANFIKAQEKKPCKILVASVDFYRPAAIEQLEILAQKASIDFYRAESKDPVIATQEIVRYSAQKGYQVLILDTAGRLQVDQPLMKELQEIKRIVVPDYAFLVLDAMTGQESIKVAQAFEETVGFSAAILTKMDSYARGGAAFAFRYMLKKPVVFMGVGEKTSDLELFKPERIASRMLDMGDILTLVEKANSKIDQEKQEQLSSAFEQGKLTLQDFADQLAMMSRLGSLSSLMRYIPGSGSLSISQEMLDKGEAELKKFRAIIGSMTTKERIEPKVLNTGRKSRIAKGAGVKTADIDMLLAKFEQSQQFVKLFKKMGGPRSFFK